MSGLVLWVVITLAGGCGSVLRFLVDEAVRTRAPHPFPFGILVVNLTGALALGVLTGAALSHDASLIASSAFVGAYTTFSTWMLDTVNAASRRLVAVAVANIVVSLALGLLVATIGRAIGMALA